MYLSLEMLFFFFSSRRRHTRYWRDWSSDVCSSDLTVPKLERAVKNLEGQVAAMEQTADRYAKWKTCVRLVPVNERSEEHTSELQSRQYLVCRLLLEKKKIYFTLLAFILLSYRRLSSSLL